MFSCTTTDVKCHARVAGARRTASSQDGQSLVEFAFLVPIVVMMIMILINIEIVLSMAGVSQKYARAQLQYLLFNHRQYFENRFLQLGVIDKYMKRFWIGVDREEDFSKASPEPYAPTWGVGPGPKPKDDDVSRGGSARQNVRVRILSFICIPPIGGQFGSRYSEDTLREDTFGTAYKYCNKEGGG